MKIKESTKSTSLLKKVAKTSATLAVLGAGGFHVAAQADEVVQDVATTSDAAKTEGKDLQAEAKAAVETAQTEATAAEEAVTTAKDAVAAQETVVAAAEEAVVEAQAAVETATADLEEAVQIRTTVENNPEVIPETEAKIEEKTVEVTEAEVTATTAEEAVAAQETVVAEAETAVATAQTEVDAAQAEVDAITAAIEEPNTVQADKTANAVAISAKEAEIAKLTAEVEQLTAAASAQAENTIASKQKEIAALQEEVAKLQEEHGKTVTTTTEASVDVAAIMGGNSFNLSSLPTNYAATVKSVNSHAAAQAVINQVASTAAANNYTTFKSNANDNYTVNLDNLTAAQQNEIAIFAVTLINQVRNHVGLNDMVITAGAQEFAASLASRYKQKYGAGLAAGYHDFSLNKVAASQVGLNANAAYAESLGNSSVPIRTMNDLKRTVYNTLQYFLFADDYGIGNASTNAAYLLGHTKNLLRGNATENAYFGLDSTSSGTYTLHFMSVLESDIVDQSKFDKTTVGTETVTTTTTIDHSAKIAALNNQITAIQNEIATLQQVVENPALSPAVQAKQAELATAQAELAEFVAKDEAYASRLAQIAEEQAGRDLTAELSEATVVLNEKTAALETAQQTLATEQASLLSLQNAQAVAQANLNTVLGELASLQTLLAKYNNPNIVEEAEAALAVAVQTLADAKVTLAEEVAALADLVKVLEEAELNYATAEATLAQAKEELARIEAQLQLDATLDTANNPATQPETSVAPKATADKHDVAKASFNVMKANKAAKSAKAKKAVKASAKATKQQGSNKAQSATLPETGSYGHHAAAMMGVTMLASAALAAYKRKED